MWGTLRKLDALIVSPFTELLETSRHKIMAPLLTAFAE
jgi:hypothetical protein